MTFEKVLQAMKEGKKVKRKAWDFNYEGYCTNQDLLADDWEIVGEEQPKPKNYLSEAMSQSADKIMECVQKQMTQAFEECADQLKQEAVKMIADSSKEPVKEKYPYYSYNTDINGKEGKYKIVFETDDWRGYRQLEEYIRENFIDKKVTQVHSSYGFSGMGKCLKCGNTYTYTSAKPLRYCMACGVEIKSNWS